MAEAKREYRNDAIAVFWEAKRCTHFGNCVRGLPAVFNPRDRPWVHVDAASADEIAHALLTCPSGALHSVYQKAAEAGRIAEDIPVNHSASFAPVIQPTLRTGTEVMVMVALAYFSRA